MCVKLVAVLKERHAHVLRTQTKKDVTVHMPADSKKHTPAPSAREMGITQHSMAPSENSDD